jgi:hypothetical protein
MTKASAKAILTGSPPVEHESNARVPYALLLYDASSKLEYDLRHTLSLLPIRQANELHGYSMEQLVFERAVSGPNSYLALSCRVC